MSSAFRTLFHYHQSSSFHYQHALRYGQSHAHHTSTVADPNYIAAKKPLLSRLFTCPCPSKSSAKDSSQPSSSSSSPSLPFQAHAGNAVRSAARRSFHEDGDGEEEVRGRSPAVRSVFSGRRRGRVGAKGGALGMLTVINQHKKMACRSRAQQQQAEEDDDDTFSAHVQGFSCSLSPFLPSIVLQLQDVGRSHAPHGLPYAPFSTASSSSITITHESPLYVHLLSMHAAKRATAAPPRLASSLLSPSSSCARDLPDEKNNDHIPMPLSASSPVAVHEAGASYLGHVGAHGQHGTGVMVYPNGDRYEGGWKDGLHHGYGVMTYQAGGRYAGHVRLRPAPRPRGCGWATTARATTASGWPACATATAASSSASASCTPGSGRRMRGRVGGWRGSRGWSTRASGRAV